MYTLLEKYPYTTLYINLNNNTCHNLFSLRFLLGLLCGLIHQVLEAELVKRLLRHQLPKEQHTHTHTSVSKYTTCKHFIQLTLSPASLLVHSTLQVLFGLQSAQSVVEIVLSETAHEFLFEVFTFTCKHKRTTLRNVHATITRR